MKIKELTKPIEPHEIEWRVQNVSRDKSKTTIVPYIKSRSVMDRLDNAFGWDNWSISFRETSTGYICRIEVNLGDRVVVKEDGASKTGIEPDKGGISDSMKRCAVQFGMGRDLYQYPKVMLKGDVKYIPDATIDRLGKMTEAINKGNFDKKLVIL